jgi:hypothetical protein
MRYDSAQAFRTALEARLRSESASTGMPLSRLRKTVAFDRLLARLSADDASAWVLKGGFALQVRYRLSSRATRDLDVLLRSVQADADSSLRRAAGFDLGDWFGFEVGRRALLTGENASRFPVTARLDGRTFETFHVDVGVGDPMTSPAEPMPVTSLLAFADVPQTIVASYPVTQQLAEKLHALTRPRTASNSRVKDLVDIVLIAESERIERHTLGSAVRATFVAGRAQEVPKELPIPPPEWRAAYRRLASDAALAAADLGTGLQTMGSRRGGVAALGGRGSALSGESPGC